MNRRAGRPLQGQNIAVNGCFDERPRGLLALTLRDSEGPRTGRSAAWPQAGDELAGTSYGGMSWWRFRSGANGFSHANYFLAKIGCIFTQDVAHVKRMMVDMYGLLEAYGR